MFVCACATGRVCLCVCHFFVVDLVESIEGSMDKQLLVQRPPHKVPSMPVLSVDSSTTGRQSTNSEPGDVHSMTSEPGDMDSARFSEDKMSSELMGVRRPSLDSTLKTPDSLGSGASLSPASPS